MTDLTESQVDAFLAAFKAISDHAASFEESDGPALVGVVQDYLGVAPGTLPVVAERVESHRFTDFDIAAEEIAGRDPDSQLVGVGGGDQRFHQTLGDMLHNRFTRFPVGQVDYDNVAVGPTAKRKVVRFGMRLFRYDGVPVAMLQRQANQRFGVDQATFEVLAIDADAVSRLLAELRELALERSVLRGQVVSFEGGGYQPEAQGVVFHERPDVPADRVILPDGVLSRIQRHVLGIAEHADELRAKGQHIKRGLLLYGPPGTGKTHTVRHLISQSHGHTVVLLAGQSLGYIDHATKVARAMQPAIVVLEDCDLIAEDRSFHGPMPLLYTVLDAMDGLSADADVVFLLTTNRVEQLERALSQRPGRVDLAAEIPLPDAHARAALLRLYAGALFTDAAVSGVAGRTEGMTASFMKELVRRAVLDAAMQGVEPVDEHLEAACEDMLSDAAALTRSLLGAGASGEGHPHEDYGDDFLDTSCGG